MADKKISDLTGLSAADVAVADIIPIVDITAGATKGVTISDLKTSIFSSPTFTGNSTFSGTEQSTSTSTGAVRITNGGLGVAGNLNVGTYSALYSTHALTVNATTNAVSMTGSLIAYGNIEAQNAIQAGGNATFGGLLTVGNRAIISGDFTVNSGNSADSPPNSPISAPAFKVDVSTERVGVNKALPDEALDVVGNIKASGSITGATLVGTLSTAAQPNITSTGYLTGLSLTDSAEFSFGSDWTLKTPGTSPNQTFEIYSEVNGVTEFKIADTGDITVTGALGINREPSGGHDLAVSGNVDVGSILSANSLETTQAVISGNLIVNTNAADSPPNSPFSAPVFKVNATTERVGINKAIPEEALDVIGNIKANGNITITGDLTVNGTTSTINTTNLDVTDNIIGLSSGLTGSTTNDAGIIIERGTEGDNAAIIWDEANDKFVLGTTTATTDTTGTIAVTEGKLKLSELETTSNIVVNGTITSSASAPNLTLKDTDGTNQITAIFNSGGVSVIQARNNTTNGIIDFRQNDGTTVTTPMRIDSNGNVGIGGASTGEKLEVTGNIKASGNITGVNLSGLLQSNNNRSVVIGELAAPSETAPNTDADPVVYRENIAIGYNALNATTTGTNNVAIGTDTLKSSTTGKNNIAIGKKALETVDSERNIALGFNCLNVANVSTDNVVIGITNLQNTTAGSIQGNTIIGRSAGNTSNVGTGNFHDNVILGRAAFQNTTASKVEDCIFIGDKAGKALKGIGDNDIGIGRNTFFGQTGISSKGITSGGNNIAIGQNAQSEATVFTRIATAKVNGATSGTTTLVVDNNSGNGLIVVGMVVAGTGISGTPTVITVTDQNNLVLSSAQTLGNNVDLTFTTTESIKGSIKIGADGGKAGSHSVNISAVDTSAAGPDGTGTREVNDITGSHSGLIAGYANSIAAETAFIGGGHGNSIATSATGAAILGGFDNEINGVGSAGMALGSNLKVQGSNQVVVGRFNEGNSNSKFIVGNGTGPSNRTNLFEVKNTGQIKLSKYGGSNFDYDGNRNYNILAIGAANNVVEIPLHDDKLDSQYLNTTAAVVGTSSIAYLSQNVEKMVVISWSGGTGTAQINLPQSSNFVKKTIRIVTDGTIPDDGIVLIKPSGSDTLGGSTSGLKLRGKHQSTMVWSDGAGNYSNIGLDSSAVKFDEADTDPVMRIRKMDQNTYDGLVTANTVDANTLYIIVA